MSTAPAAECGGAVVDSSLQALLTRRRLIVAAAASAGLAASWRLASVDAAEPALDSTAQADLAARRLQNAQVVVAPTTTVPIFTPPAAGEILFPLALGDEWNAFVLENYGDTRGRCCGYFHQGVDIMAAEHTPQVAVVDGVLTQWHDGGFHGWTLTGDDATVYRYFHNTPDQNGWSEGDRVSQGDVIGFVGDTGTSAGNFHLHFEYRPSNVPADPYFKLQRITGASFMV
ncbi:MAG: M23 family metallopeptidase [Ilumatobacter sp.]